MIKDNKILIGKADDQEIYLLPKMANRHGLIAGATGTGKTVTLKVLAEGFSDLGVPVFIADIKGDVSGLCVSGSDFVLNRASEMALSNFKLKAYPVEFFDVYGKNGHPIRATVKDMGPMMLANILELSDSQTGILNIVFKIAEEKALDLIDLEDLKTTLRYINDHTDELILKYGNITKQSVATLIRNILVLEQEGGSIFFGEPAFNINDLIRFDGVNGIINILDCQKLFQRPKLYTVFLIWLLDSLYNSLPEVGDLERPKMIFFFDEAHLIFSNSSKLLLEKFEQVIKLIRSKGVGIYFCTQNPRDINDNVLAQLSNRIQHALRAYTPNEIKAVKLAADSFRANIEFDTGEAIITLKTGQALVSTLDEQGAPIIVQKTKICPPSSSLDAIDDTNRNNCIKTSFIYGKYEERLERMTAHEHLTKETEDLNNQKILEQEQQKLQKEAEKLKKEQQKLLEKKEKAHIKQLERQRIRNERHLNRAISGMTSVVSREIGKTIIKGIKNLFSK